MKKIKCIGIVFALLLCGNVNAWTGNWCEYGTKDYDEQKDVEVIEVTSYRETTNLNDEYDTIEKNSTIIGKTKFTPDQIITAVKASNAGYDFAILKAAGDHHGFDYDKYPDIYIYYGEVGGWYKIDENNQTTYIEDSETINELSTQDIYAINNVKKSIFVGSFEKDDVEGNYMSICLDLGLYHKLVDDNNLNFYITSMNPHNFSQTLSKKYIDFRYNNTTSSYDITIYSLSLEDVEGSVIDQKRVFIRDSEGNTISHAARIMYTNENSEVINIDSNGYLIPNMSAVEDIYLING